MCRPTRGSAVKRRRHRARPGSSRRPLHATATKRRSAGGRYVAMHWPPSIRRDSWLPPIQQPATSPQPPRPAAAAAVAVLCYVRRRRWMRARLVCPTPLPAAKWPAAIAAVPVTVTADCRCRRCLCRPTHRPPHRPPPATTLTLPPRLCSAATLPCQLSSTPISTPSTTMTTMRRRPRRCRSPSLCLCLPLTRAASTQHWRSSLCSSKRCERCSSGRSTTHSQHRTVARPLWTPYDRSSRRRHEVVTAMFRQVVQYNRCFRRCLSDLLTVSRTFAAVGNDCLGHIL